MRNVVAAFVPGLRSVRPSLGLERRKEPERMDRINELLIRLYLRGREEKGISGTEYLVLLVVLVMAIAAAFAFAGDEIDRRVRDFFDDLSNL
jgi:Flp pilus assembly pilin Flp